MLKLNYRVVPFLILLLMAAGCASTKVTDATPMQQNPGIRRPNNIWVYPFVTRAQDIPSESDLSSQASAPATPPSAAQEEQARKFGMILAQRLVDDLNQMGMTATLANDRSKPQIGDGILRGYIVSTEGGGTGNAAKRFVIGFGSGTSQMQTVVEGYGVTPFGIKKMGSGTLDSQGSKTPGVVMPAALAIATGNPIGLAVMGGMKLYGEASGKNSLEGRAKATADEIAAKLKERFQQRGWIS